MSCYAVIVLYPVTVNYTTTLLFFCGSRHFLVLVNYLLSVVETPTFNFISIQEVFLDQSSFDAYFIALPPMRQGYGLIGTPTKTQDFKCYFLFSVFSFNPTIF